ATRASSATGWRARTCCASPDSASGRRSRERWFAAIWPSRYADSMSTKPGAVVLDADRAVARARDLCSFIDASPMPFQAVAESARRLAAAGFEELTEGDAWTLEAGRGYFVTRNASTILAFRLAAKAPSETGVALVGAHVDSPNLRLKPRPETGAEGYRQLGVEVYGGP